MEAEKGAKSVSVGANPPKFGERIDLWQILQKSTGLACLIGPEQAQSSTLLLFPRRLGEGLPWQSRQARR